MTHWINCKNCQTTMNQISFNGNGEIVWCSKCGTVGVIRCVGLVSFPVTTNVIYEKSKKEFFDKLNKNEPLPSVEGK